MHETAAFVVKPETSPERQAFYKRLDQVDTAPLWEVLNRLVLPLPQPAIVPALWKYDDVRDLPIVNMFDTSFAEHHPEETQPVARSDGDALARYGANMLPLEYAPPRGKTSPSPVFNYPYSRSREALRQLSKNGPADPHHGFKLPYVNPASGGYPLPTIAAFLQLLPDGFSSKPYRSTDSTIYNVVEGKGRSTIGTKTLTW